MPNLVKNIFNKDNFDNKNSENLKIQLINTFYEVLSDDAFKSFFVDSSFEINKYLYNDK